MFRSVGSSNSDCQVHVFIIDKVCEKINLGWKKTLNEWPKLKD